MVDLIDTMESNSPKVYIHSFIKYLAIFAIGAFVIVYAIRFYDWLYHPFSNSYEEYGTVATMNCYLDGVNPFSFDTFPEKTFIYGPLYAWLCASLYQLFGFQSEHLLFCRLLSVVFLLLTEIIVLWEIYKRLNPSLDKLTKALLLLVAFGSLLAVSWQITPVSGYSNTFGVFLTALVYLIITSKDKHKVWSLLLCSLLSLVAFFVKQYFIIVFVVAFVQLIIQGAKRQAIFLASTFVVFAVVAFLLCQAYMPTCLYVLVEAMSHQEISVLHCFKQYAIIIAFYLPYLGALLYILKTDKDAFHNIPATYKSGVLVALLCLTIIGCNTGAYLWYFYHLLVLPLVVCGTIALSYIKSDWIPGILLVCVVLSMFHINMNTIAPSYPKQATSELKSQLAEIENSYNLSKSYNFHASLDNWAAKHEMGYVNSLYPKFLLMMQDKDNVILFKNEHVEATSLLNKWETSLKHHIVNKDAEIIICNSNDEVLEKCGLNDNYQLLKRLTNPDGDPKYTDIDIFVKK